MNTLSKNPHVARRGAVAALLTASLLILAGCDGIEAASKQTEKMAFRANFSQVPLIADDGSPGRVLKMHIFQGSTGSARQVPFYAQLEL